MNGRDAGRAGCPSPFLAPGGGRAAKPVPKGRERSGPHEHATAKPGCLKEHSERPQNGRNWTPRRWKRSVTGENADVVIVTSESPRFEDPESIIDDIVKGIPAGARWHREIDRRAAIELALRIAEPNDIVILAGKGHENVRYIQGEVIPFNDRTVVTELLQTRI